ncbi:hypothetical protein CEXT_335901 [Caerostris extrusa]|uniref:Uncharacterized protein n=1 Tax=Caerostris extrusa TaxID=172846 RepID=A0AAV4TYV4_CAEEX|nr:hypothetical protein CEXT_335901 [Caerostris extrusa]
MEENNVVEEAFAIGRCRITKLSTGIGTASRVDMFHDHVQWGVLSQMKPSRERRDGSFRVMVLQLRVLSGSSVRLVTNQ